MTLPRPALKSFSYRAGTLGSCKSSNEHYATSKSVLERTWIRLCMAAWQTDLSISHTGNPLSTSLALSYGLLGVGPGPAALPAASSSEDSRCRLSSPEQQLSISAISKNFQLCFPNPQKMVQCSACQGTDGNPAQRLVYCRIVPSPHGMGIQGL